jgi:hypothetical protein
VADGCKNWASDALVEVLDDRRAWFYATVDGHAHDAGPQGGAVHRYATADGGATWSLDRVITPKGKTFGALTLVHAAHPDARLLFCDRSDNAVYLWGERGYVGAAGIAAAP